MIVPLLPLPRLVFGAGAIAGLAQELATFAIDRPLLLSDRGLERAGVVERVRQLLPQGTACHLDVPENPTAAGADAAHVAYRAAGCDGVIALGGGSVIDTAKIVAALAAGAAEDAPSLLGRPERIGTTVPLIAIPTTVGTGSESSPVAALHMVVGGAAVATRTPHLVPRAAICDPDLARTLPPRLIAATGIDALSHCLEGYCAAPANPVVDALALDGIAQAFANVHAATAPAGDEARAALMAAAFAGGAAIHKGLGPAHAIALACSDQAVPHGVLIAAALPLTVELVLPHIPAKAARIAACLGLAGVAEIAGALGALVRSLGLPPTFREAGYVTGPFDALVEASVASPFNRSSPYAPSAAEYATTLRRLL